jgi:integrase
MAKKRGQNEGSIIHRKTKDGQYGRYEVRISVDGRQRTVGYAWEADEAQRIKTAALRDRDRGMPFIGDNITLAQFAAEWLAMKRPDLKESAYRSYEAMLRVHILPTLGNKPLKKITPPELQRLYAARRGATIAGKRTQRVSSATVRRAHEVVHNLLDDARRLGHVPINICDNVDPPKPERHTMRVLTADQVAAFLDAVQGDRLEALYILDLTTGMRQGELLGLRWQDVDLDSGMLRITSTLYRRQGGEYLFTAPRTRESDRAIALAPMAVEALRAHRARQAQERLAAADGWQNFDLVFPLQNGSPIDGRNLLRYEFHRLLRQAGLPEIRFHDLRHTFATLLAEHGPAYDVTLKDVSAALGHSSTKITGDLYTHVTTGMKRRVARAAEAIVRPSREQS